MHWPLSQEVLPLGALRKLGAPQLPEEPPAALSNLRHKGTGDEEAAGGCQLAPSCAIPPASAYLARGDPVLLEN